MTNTSAVTVVAPMAGTITALRSVTQPLYSSGSAGAGVAIVPDPTKELVQVVAPVSGTLVRVEPSLFVIDPEGESEQRILVKLGIRTEELEGQGYDMHWPVDVRIKQGQPVVTYTPKELGRMGFDPIVLVIGMGCTFDEIDMQARIGEVCDSGTDLFRV